MMGMNIPLLGMLLGASALKVGDRAPDFSLPSTDNRTVTLSKLLENGPVILAFFPKAFTPGCTRELSAYRDQSSEVEKKGAQVIGVSTDDLVTQRRFKDSLKFTYPLLSDKGGKVAALYGGTIPALGLANRATYVIDQKGIIQQIVTGGDAIDPAAAIASCPLSQTGRSP
jgi:thioredoxin-dependent peroxiredoxin